MPDSAEPQTREITLRHLVRLIRDCWRTLLFYACGAFILAFIALFLIAPSYTVAIKVAAIPQQTGSNNMSGLSAVSGLSALLRGNQTSDEFRRYQTALTTVELGRRLMAYHSLMNIAFPGSWDSTRNSYRTTGRLLGPLYALFGEPTTKTVTPDAVASYLSSRLKIDQPDDQTDVVTISMNSPNPRFAEALLMAVHKEAAEMLRQGAEQRANRMIEYLNGRLTTLTVQDYRQSLLFLMGAQENLRLLSQPGVAYAAEVIDPPHASDFPTFPKPPFFLAVAVVIGLAAGLIIIVFMDAVGMSARYPLRRTTGRRDLPPSRNAASGRGNPALYDS